MLRFHTSLKDILISNINLELNTLPWHYHSKWMMKIQYSCLPFLFHICLILLWVGRETRTRKKTPRSFFQQNLLFIFLTEHVTYHRNGWGLKNVHSKMLSYNILFLFLLNKQYKYAFKWVNGEKYCIPPKTREIQI